MYEILPMQKSNFVRHQFVSKIEDSSANFMENTVLAGNFTKYVTHMGMCTAIHGKC